MRPYKFKVKPDGTVVYYYKTKDWLKFHALGKLHGDVGMILVRRNGLALTYFCYGTIERPSRTMITMTMMHMPGFDGEMPTDEERCKPSEYTINPKDYSFMIIDLNKKDEN